MEFEFARPDGEPTLEDLRVEVCGRVGMNQRSYEDTGLTKSTLNSLVAYLTGSFAVRPRNLHREESRAKLLIMEDVAKLCDLTGWLEKFQSWDEDGTWEGDDGKMRETAPGFGKEDLEGILEAMEEEGDQREWLRE